MICFASRPEKSRLYWRAGSLLKNIFGIKKMENGSGVLVMTIALWKEKIRQDFGNALITIQELVWKLVKELNY